MTTYNIKYACVTPQPNNTRQALKRPKPVSEWSHDKNSRPKRGGYVTLVLSQKKLYVAVPVNGGLV